MLRLHLDVYFVDPVYKVCQYSMRMNPKLRGFSPRANHTDRVAAAGRQS